VMGFGRFIARFREALPAVVAIDEAALLEWQIDQRVAERAAPAVATDFGCLVVDEFDFAGSAAHGQVCSRGSTDATLGVAIRIL